MLIAARWAALSVFFIASALNYLDRQLLAALAPVLRQEFRLTNEDFGWLISAFSVVYALSALPAGFFIDRVGLTRGTVTVVGLWSLVSMATGLTTGFAGLLACRAALGFAEAGAIPASGKASALYLPPHERALGSAMSQLGISLGLIAAPVMAGLLTNRLGWRSTFVLAGALGFVWIPAWIWTSRRFPPAKQALAGSTARHSELLRDGSFWGLILATVLAMTVYSLWTNWTTLFLVQRHGMPQAQANVQLAWIPPLFGTLGGLLGGTLTLRLSSRGVPVHQARLLVCAFSALAMVVTAAIPWMPSAGLATAAIAFSFFCSVTFSVNLYAIPLDVFGPQRAAFTVAALTFAYGAMQTLQSPVIGRILDVYGFEPVCTVAAALPLVATALLRWTVRQP